MLEITALVAVVTVAGWLVTTALAAFTGLSRLHQQVLDGRAAYLAEREDRHRRVRSRASVVARQRHEFGSLLRDLAESRARLGNAGLPPGQTDFRGSVSVNEEWPDLSNYSDVPDFLRRLDAHEEALAEAARAYRKLAGDYNLQRARFPAVLVVHLCGFPPADLDIPPAEWNLGGLA